MFEEPENVEEIKGKLDKIEEYLLGLNKPQDFSPENKENALVHLEMTYENLCSMLAMNGVSSIKELTVFEFYSRLRYYKNSTAPKK